MSCTLRADPDFWEFAGDDESGGMVVERLISAGSFTFLTRHMHGHLPHLLLLAHLFSLPRPSFLSHLLPYFDWFPDLRMRIVLTFAS